MKIFDLAHKTSHFKFFSGDKKRRTDCVRADLHTDGVKFINDHFVAYLGRLFSGGPLKCSPTAQKPLHLSNLNFDSDD